MSASQRRQCRTDTKAQREQTKKDRKQIKQLERELQRKEKARAETGHAAGAPPKGPCDPGGRRRRIISHADRCHAVELIDETISAGARQRKACEILEISTPLSALDPG